MKLIPPSVVDIIVPSSGLNTPLENCFGYSWSGCRKIYAELEEGWQKSLGLPKLPVTFEPQVQVGCVYADDRPKKLRAIDDKSEQKAHQHLADR
jgi:hypothetical protein